MQFPYYWLVVLFSNVNNIFHRIRYCVISCPRAISNSVIQSVNTVIVLLFCLLPVIILFTGIELCYSAIYRYYDIYRYSALLLFHSVLVLVLALLCVSPVCYYTLLVLIHTPNCCWRPTMCLLIVPYIMYNVLLLVLDYASMPFVLSCIL